MASDGGSAAGEQRPRRVGDTMPTPRTHWDRSAVGESVVFRVRKGPDYKRNKLKAPSEPPMYAQVGMDLFRSPKKCFKVCEHIQLPKPPPGLDTPINGVPPYSPSMFSTPGDGETVNMCMYFLMLPETREQLKPENIEAARPCYRLLRDFVLDDSKEMRDRFKAMANLRNLKELGFNTLLYRLINEYNMKPVLTRPEHNWSTDGKTYIEVNIDVHIFNYVARKGWHGMITMIPRMVVEAAVTIEAYTNEEMPENLLGVAICDRVDLEAAPMLHLNDAPRVTQYSETLDAHDMAPDVFPPPLVSLAFSRLAAQLTPALFASDPYLDCIDDDRPDADADADADFDADYSPLDSTGGTALPNGSRRGAEGRLSSSSSPGQKPSRPHRQEEQEPHAHAHDQHHHHHHFYEKQQRATATLAATALANASVAAPGAAGGGHTSTASLVAASAATAAAAVMAPDRMRLVNGSTQLPRLAHGRPPPLTTTVTATGSASGSVMAGARPQSPSTVSRASVRRTFAPLRRPRRTYQTTASGDVRSAAGSGTGSAGGGSSARSSAGGSPSPHGPEGALSAPGSGPGSGPVFGSGSGTAGSSQGPPTSPSIAAAAAAVAGGVGVGVGAWRRTSPMIQPISPRVKVETTMHMSPSMVERLRRRREAEAIGPRSGEESQDDEFHDALGDE